jgi:uncharacterized protein YutE (UPF0331/DUF86 family)
MDTNRINQKLRELETYIEELNDFLPDSKESFMKSIEKRRSIERELQIMIDCVIDICFLLIKELHKGLPVNEQTVFDILKDNLTNIKNLKKMRGFRNVLVHRYGAVDNELVYQFIHDDLGDFDIFISDVQKLIKK